MLTLWGGEGTSRLGMVHRESSIGLIYANYSAVARVYPAPTLPYQKSRQEAIRRTVPDENNHLRPGAYRFKDLATPPIGRPTDTVPLSPRLRPGTSVFAQ